MVRKRVIAAAAAAVVSLTGFAASAQAQTTGNTPGITAINLHRAYEHSLAHARAGRLSGIVYARGKHSAAGAGARRRAPGTHAPCGEPDCPLIYNGGPVEHSPRVYLLLWGPAWTADPAQADSASYLAKFFGGLGVFPQDDWSTITSQYGDGTGSPSFGAAVLAGTFQDTSAPPAGVTQNQLAAEASAFVSSKGITGLGDAQIVIATQSGTCPDGFYAPGCAGGTGTYCAWHTNVGNIAFTNLPYQLDAGSGCGEDLVQNQYDGFSIVGGHEYAETITDPYPISGWWDPNDPSGGEIADKCAWTELGALPLSTGSFAIQPLFSNAAYTAAGAGCVRSAPPPGGEIKGYGGKCLTDPSNSGTDRTMIVISACTGATGQLWRYTGHTLQVMGKCLDDRGYGGAGTGQILYTCNGGSNQTWSYRNPASEYIGYKGLCLTDPGNSVTDGTQVTLDVCQGTANQRWTRP